MVKYYSTTPASTADLSSQRSRHTTRRLQPDSQSSRLPSRRAPRAQTSRSPHFANLESPSRRPELQAPPPRNLKPTQRRPASITESKKEKGLTTKLSKLTLATFPTPPQRIQHARSESVPTQTSRAIRIAMEYKQVQVESSLQPARLLPCKPRLTTNAADTRCN